MESLGRKRLYADVIMAGFGGQGLMFIGKLLAYSAMKAGLNVTWIPSYGPEMRGGTANCTVVISSEEIGSPVITSPKALIIMNNPSLEAFEPRLEPEGMLFLNSSLVTRSVERKDIKVMPTPANAIAAEVGEPKTANMVMLGCYISKTKLLPPETVLEGLKEFFEKKARYVDVNIQAFEKGVQYTKR
ncbi:MAG: 2-oxoacid:acceptor oxidoreductase family protein [Candidatus Bathyarchaeota archaeon]|jgi:2-oxoglutarate ferredoxin oxidoreductase subunit gamma|nr:MAG: 2-oxoacid:acceptor oxidoreductase family protein [Candidatus Bathyarchaeota archaeon]